MDGEHEVESDDSSASSYIPRTELLKNAFGIDLPTCPKCGGRVRVIAVITEVKAIFKILNHVGLGSDPPKGQFPTKEEYVYESFY